MKYYPVIWGLYIYIYIYTYIIKNKPSWFIRILSLNNLVFHGFSLPPAAFLPWVFQPQGPFVGIRNHTRRKRRNLLHLRGAQIRPLLNLDREGRYLGVVGKMRLKRKLVAWHYIVRGWTTQSKNMSQNGFIFPKLGVNIKKIFETTT